MAFIEIASKIGFTNNTRGAVNLAVLCAARFIHSIDMDSIGATPTYEILTRTRPLVDTFICPLADHHRQPPQPPLAIPDNKLQSR
ncbi:hypothetical protein PGT21_026050 [Puccinia graminis f. sp. tritici]|uniref:Uncharacterized protein n=1 Tax=Puccinia graminis f. sp. tritici TaxID=56615 RepID=A0A5B0N1Q6_PUCGR|nr:hypothetical protein PGT21_026050 [Puccinia graminis f. sp. tritici]KAA1123938.1 hypothetical protein PGTUg99_006545 [Puccinia graminis f. sp. tritici]